MPEMSKADLEKNREEWARTASSNREKNRVKGTTYRVLTKEDYYGYAGATNLPDGSGPYLDDDGIADVIFSGYYKGEVDDPDTASIGVYYQNPNDVADMLCYSHDIKYFSEVSDIATRYFKDIIEMVHKAKTVEDLKKICIVYGMEQIV